MRVNNLIERKNRREAIRAGKVNKDMGLTAQSKFSARSNATSKFSKKSKATAATKMSNKDPAKAMGKQMDTRNMLARHRSENSSGDEMDNDMKEMLAQRELEDLDMKYLIGDTQEQEEYEKMTRGVNKQKQ